MIGKRPLSDRSIIEHLNIYYGIEVILLTPLLLGADMNASIYKAQAHDQKYYFIKLKVGHNHDIGVAILDLLHKERIQQIIPPIKTSQGLLTQHIDEYTLIVYSYIENEN